MTKGAKRDHEESKMPRFIALPVGRGDAFFLETDKGSVLMDGGRAVKSFAHLFKTYAQRDGVDVLVATHNDADHANGVLGFLEAGLKCHEVWLPGRWAQVLRQVLRPWEEVVYVLARQVEEVRIDELKPEGSLLEQYAESVDPHFEAQRHDEEDQELEESGWPHETIPLLEATPEEEDEWGALPWWDWWLYWGYRRFLPYWPPHVLRRRLFLEAIVAAKRIRQIALEAYHRGIAVRWFEWDTQNPSGGYEWLEPLNGRRIVRVKPVKEEVLLHFLALTVWNRESPVFWVPPEYAGGGVLFTADSDLKGVRLPTLQSAIVTTPHHGPAANKEVYKLINTPVIWVRSDGRSRKRPCSEYLRTRGRRYCTLCRNAKSTKQAVIFWQRAGGWVRGRGVRPCICE